MKAIVVAMDRHRVIGKNNQLPWHLPADLKHFKKTTMGHHIIMGRKTFESVGRPLPGRVNVVISRNPDFRADDVIVVHSLDEAYRVAVGDEQVFVIGGSEIFREALPGIERLYLTLIDHSFEGDTYFPELSLDDWILVSREDHQPDEKNRFPYSFVVYDRT